MADRVEGRPATFRRSAFRNSLMGALATVAGIAGGTSTDRTDQTPNPKKAEIKFTDNSTREFLAISVMKHYALFNPTSPVYPNVTPPPNDTLSFARPILEQMKRWVQTSKGKRIETQLTDYKTLQEVIAVDSPDHRYTTAFRVWMFSNDPTKHRLTLDLFDRQTRVYQRLAFSPNTTKPEMFYSKSILSNDRVKRLETEGTDWLVGPYAGTSQRQSRDLQIILDTLRLGVLNPSYTQKTAVLNAGRIGVIR